MSLQLLLFSSEDNVYALPIESVVHVIQALEITTVPEASPLLYGVFDLQGITIPVVCARQLFSFPEKNLELDDALIILNVHDHKIALLTDQVNGVFALEKEDFSEVEELFPELVMIYVVKWNERLVPVLDIDRLIDQETAKDILLQEIGT